MTSRAVQRILLAGLLAMGAGAQELSVSWARLAVEGSGRPIRVEGSRATTHLDLRAVGGDPREVVVPVLHVEAAGPPGVHVDGGEAPGSARFLGWIDPPATGLDPHLQIRSRPVLSIEVPGASAALLWILLGLGVLSFATRNNAWASLALAGVGGVLAFLLGRGTPMEGPVPQRVLEGRLDGQRWLVVDVGVEFELDPAWAVEHQVDPPDAPLVLRMAEGRGRAVMRVPEGCEIVRRFELDPGLRLLTPELNTWGPMEQTWSRGGEGAGWTGHGAWPVGAELPAGVSERPPGWLAAGLPQGRGVLAGRLGEGAFRGPDDGPPPGPGARTWVRLVGFR